jgi:hypothetical protein
MRLAITESALKQLGKLFIERMKNEIKKKQYPYAPGFAGDRPTTGKGDKYASGALYNSLAYQVFQADGQPALKLIYNDYFERVNIGIKPSKKYGQGKSMGSGNGGTSPFIQALLGWMTLRNIRPKNKKGKFIPKLGVALAIRKNIFRYGIAPAGFYDKTQDKLEMLFENPPPYIAVKLTELGVAIGNDVENLMDNILKEP